MVFFYMRNLRCIAGASDKPVEREWKLAVPQREEGFLLFCFVSYSKDAPVLEK